MTLPPPVPDPAKWRTGARIFPAARSSQRTEKPEAGVVDGQERLTTLKRLLSVFRDLAVPNLAASGSFVPQPPILYVHFMYRRRAIPRA